MMKQTFWKKVVTVLLAMTMLLSLTACGNSGTSKENKPTGGDNSKTEGNTGKTDLQEEQKEEDTGATNGEKESITIGVTGVWATLSPYQTTSNQFGTFVRLLYDRLAFLTPEGEYVSQAAKSWAVEEDGVTWNVEIYDTIYDSAGNHITASDIVWNLQENMRQALKPFFNKIEQVEQTGDYTLKITMKNNVVGAFELVLINTYAVSQTAYESSSDGFATSVVSSSPYEVTEFVAGSHLTFKKRDDYWKTDADSPYLQNNVKTVTYQVINEASQQQIALETGTVDAFEGLTPSLVRDFEANNQFSIAGAPSSNGSQMFFSGHESRSVANDVNLRLAICYAIDVDGLIASCYDGYAEPMHDPAVNTLVGYLQKWDSEEYYGYDVEKAKDYLAKSDYNGETLEIMQSSGTQGERVVQMIQGYLMAIGIDCKLTILDSALFSASRFDGSQYDMIMIAGGGVTLPAFWGNRFDMNAYELGDGTSRHDETLTQMLYDTWVYDGFTEENIDAIHQYLLENCIAYGLVNTTINNVYHNSLGLTKTWMSYSGTVDYVASEYEG